MRVSVRYLMPYCHAYAFAVVLVSRPNFLLQTLLYIIIITSLHKSKNSREIYSHIAHSSCYYYYIFHYNQIHIFEHTLQSLYICIF